MPGVRGFGEEQVERHGARGTSFRMTHNSPLHAFHGNSSVSVGEAHLAGRGAAASRSSDCSALLEAVHRLTGAD